VCATFVKIILCVKVQETLDANSRLNFLMLGDASGVSDADYNDEEVASSNSPR
jgi:hypothetical protein